ncbi:unnamed protein product [Effrenium voratum]|nr:unnamed protein product [Effrenium voratum]
MIAPRQETFSILQRRRMSLGKGAGRSELRVGERLQGVVSHVTNTLVLVDVGLEKEGLVPLSKMAAGLGIEQVAVGDEVKVWVSQLTATEDLRRGQVVLAMDEARIFGPGSFEEADLEDFRNVSSEEWLVGTVVAKPSFGLLVALPSPRAMERHCTGLVYKSQVLGNQAVGDQVRVRVLNVNVEKKKLALSMKAHLSWGPGGS